MKRTMAAFALVLTTLLPAWRAVRPELVEGRTSRLARSGQQDPAWLQRLQRWLEAAERHQPGSDDAGARVVATWSRSDLRTLLSDLLELRRLMGRAWDDSAPLEAQVISYGGREFRLKELQQLLGLNDDEARRGVINRILWAGALLHTDVVLQIPSDDRPATGPTAMLRLRDGQPDGYEYPMTAHWDLARGLLDALQPNPSSDETVLTWYKAVGSYLLTSSISDAAAQLQHGRQLFPHDAELLFFSGCVQEAYSVPMLHEAARSVALAPGEKIVLESPQSYLRQAETYFRKSLEKDPRLVEARVRLGHVLGLLGQHREAAEQLRQAATTIGDSQVVYFLCLFLGQEEQAVGDTEAARGWYERAATIYPRAQSPLFALSELASRSGDMAGAMRAVDRIRQLPADEKERADPWVTYYVAGGRNARTLLGNLFVAVPKGGKR